MAGNAVLIDQRFLLRKGSRIGSGHGRARRTRRGRWRSRRARHHARRSRRRRSVRAALALNPNERDDRKKGKREDQPGRRGPAEPHFRRSPPPASRRRIGGGSHSGRWQSTSMMTMRNLNNTQVQPAGRRETAGAVPVCVCHKHGAGFASARCAHNCWVRSSR